MTASTRFVVVMAAGLLPWAQDAAAPQDRGNRQVFHLTPGPESPPATPDVRAELRWDPARRRLIRQCGGLDADSNSQLWLLAARAQRERPKAAVVLDLDPGVGLTDVLTVLREAPPGLPHQVAGAGIWQRVAPAAAPAAGTLPASLPDPDPPRPAVELIAPHVPRRPPCEATEAGVLCRDPDHWCLCIRGKPLGDRALLVERLTWEAAQRGPVGGPGAFATHRVLLRCSGEAPCSVLLKLAEACVATGFRRLEIEVADAQVPASRPR